MAGLEKPYGSFPGECFLGGIGDGLGYTRIPGKLPLLTLEGP